MATVSFKRLNGRGDLQRKSTIYFAVEKYLQESWSLVPTVDHVENGKI